jgi:hypothetical protein
MRRGVLCVSSLCRPTDLDGGHGEGRIHGTVLRGRMLQAFTFMEHGGVIYGTEIMSPGEGGWQY